MVLRRQFSSLGTFVVSSCRLSMWTVAVGLLMVVQGDAKELITTGTFDGDLDPWITVSQSLLEGEEPRGDWFLDRVGSFTPSSFQPTSRVGEAEGDYAVSDQIDEEPNQRGGNESILLQIFSVPENPESVILSFDMFVNDWSSRPGLNPLQHGRVDIMDVDADLFDVEDGVLANLYLGTDGGPLPNPFRRYEFEIAPFVRPGGDFAIRFYHVNSFDTMNIGVDNVSIWLVPEPSTIALALVAITCTFIRRRRPMSTL